MTDERACRDQVVECCRRMHDRGYVSGGEGNVSVRLGAGRLLVTPTGVNKGFLRPADLVVTDLDGQPARGGPKPSSEIRVHVAAYRARPDANAVVHAHPPTAIALTIAGLPVAQCLIPEAVVTLGDVPTVPYATPSSTDLAAAVERLAAGHDVLMLDRHGSLTLGADLAQAYDRLESLEHTALISWRARTLGPVAPLPAAEVDRLRRMAEALGLRRSGAACCGLCSARGTPAPAASSPDDALVRELVGRVLERLKP